MGRLIFPNNLIPIEDSLRRIDTLFQIRSVHPRLDSTMNVNSRFLVVIGNVTSSTKIRTTVNIRQYPAKGHKQDKHGNILTRSATPSQSLPLVPYASTAISPRPTIPKKERADRKYHTVRPGDPPALP